MLNGVNDTRGPPCIPYSVHVMIIRIYVQSAQGIDRAVQFSMGFDGPCRPPAGDPLAISPPKIVSMFASSAALEMATSLKINRIYSRQKGSETEKFS